jgi:hypothetical protein
MPEAIIKQRDYVLRYVLTLCPEPGPWDSADEDFF